MPDGTATSKPGHGRSLTLHIGIPKTGSTALQTWFRLNRRLLLSRGVCYPISPGSGNHVLLPASIVENSPWIRTMHPAEFDGLPPDVRIRQFPEQWRAEMDGLPPGVTKVIMSTEYCSIMLTDVPTIERLAAMLRPWFHAITIVVYLRRQDLHVASVYSERLRQGETEEPHLPEADLQSLPEYDYATLLGRWAAVFGESAIRPRIYERVDLVKRDVIDDFLFCAGIERPGGADDTPPLNQAIGRRGQIFLRRAARRMHAMRGAAFMGSLTWKAIAAACTHALPGQGWRAPRDEAQAFLTRFAQTNEAVRARYFPERDSLFATDLSDLPAQPEEEPQDAAFDSALEVLETMVYRNGQHIAALSSELARLYRKNGELDQAKRKLVVGVSFAPSHVPSRILLADICIDRGEFAEAREHLAAITAPQAHADWAERVAVRLARVEAHGPPAGKPGPRNPPTQSAVAKRVS